VRIWKIPQIIKSRAKARYPPHKPDDREHGTPNGGAERQRTREQPRCARCCVPSQYPLFHPRISCHLVRLMKTHKSAKSADSLRPFSSLVFDGDERAAARAMLYPVGFKAEDFKKPLIGVASTWSDVTPCNMHLDKLARESEQGVNKNGGQANR